MVPLTQIIEPAYTALEVDFLDTIHLVWSEAIQIEFQIADTLCSRQDLIHGRIVSIGTVFFYDYRVHY